MRLEEYRSNIDRLISEATGEYVLNGSHEHASIIIERMLTHAQNHVRILCRRFDPRIFGTIKTVEAAKLFLGVPERKLDIIIEEFDGDYLVDHPFFAAIDAKENLRLAELNEIFKKPVNFNFSTMDEIGFRFEEDKAQPVAIAAFGADPLFMERLIETFDKLFKLSQPVEVNRLQAV